MILFIVGLQYLFVIRVKIVPFPDHLLNNFRFSHFWEFVSVFVVFLTSILSVKLFKHCFVEVGKINLNRCAKIAISNQRRTKNVIQIPSKSTDLIIQHYQAF